MRIIEPKSIKNKQKLSKKHKVKNPLLFIGLLAALLILFNHVVPDQQPSNLQSVVSRRPRARTLQNFSDQEFLDLNSNIFRPNLVNIDAPPDITGNQSADARIRKLAKVLGYQLTAQPASNLNKGGQFADLQPLAKLDWDAMIAAAGLKNITMTAADSFISIEEQRSKLLRELKNNGLFIESIARGYVDSRLTKILKATFPPGYSPYHSGYRVKVKCISQPQESFTQTQCFNWLANNNYQNAKSYGWIPAHPRDLQKSNELVWVGQKATFK